MRTSNSPLLSSVFDFAAAAVEDAGGPATPAPAPAPAPAPSLAILCAALLSAACLAAKRNAKVGLYTSHACTSSKVTCGSLADTRRVTVNSTDDPYDGKRTVILVVSLNARLHQS